MHNSVIKKGIVSGIILLFISVIVIPSIGLNIIERHGLQDNYKGFNPRGDILYVGGVGPNNYTKIMDAIKNASDGDTVFVYDDSSPYNEYITLDISINLVGEDKNTTIINSGFWYAIFVSADWINISGFTINCPGWDSRGIQINSNYNTITNNTITHCYTGILIDGYYEPSNYNTISGNTISGNYFNGISVGRSGNNIIKNNIIFNISGHYSPIALSIYDSNNNTITGNTISKNYYGLILSHSSYNVMRNNTINDNSYRDFDIEGSDISHFSQDIDTTNTINSKPIYYLVEQSDLVIDDTMSIGYLGLISCKKISVNNLEFTNQNQGLLIMNTSNSIFNSLIIHNNSKQGIAMYYSSNNNIMNSIIYNNLDLGGIWLFHSDNITITGNTISNNSFDGIRLDYSYNNTITGNTISDNIDDGIYLGYSNCNTITGNTISNNWDDGIILIHSSSNTITDNTLSNNRCGIYLSGSNSNNITHSIISNNWDGIYLQDSNSNTILGNAVSDNKNDGINLSFSSSNTIQKNTFRGNKRDAFFENTQSNKLWERNTWRRNYWNRPRLLPKLIFGKIEINSKEISWFNIDWRPALKSYDI